MKARLIVLPSNLDYQPIEPYVVVESEGEHLTIVRGVDVYYLGEKPIDALTLDDLARFRVQSAILSEVRELANNDIFSREFREEVWQWHAEFLRQLREQQPPVAQPD